MSLDIWFQLLNLNITIKLLYGFFFYEKVLQEVFSKDPILKIVVDLNRNDVGIYQYYYKNVKNKTATFQWRTMGNPIYDPLSCSNKWPKRLHDTFWSNKKSEVKSKER